MINITNSVLIEIFLHQLQKKNSNQIPNKLLVAQWISQGGMQIFLVLFLSFFFFYGLMSFFESSEEISKNFPEISEDFKYFSKEKSTSIGLEVVKDFIIKNEIVMNLFWILFNFSIFISASTTSASAYSLYLANPNQKTSTNFGHVFNLNLIFISMLYDINMNCFRFWPFENIICIKVAFLAFGINFMLWTFTHIVLYYKAKCAKTH